MLITVVVVIVAITAASFFLNAVFAFAISVPPPPKIRPAFAQARARLGVVLGWGAAVGVLLGISAVVVDRWGTIWFAICMSIAIGVMIFCYVAVPARLIGITRPRSRRDKLTASAIGAALGGIVCTPPHVVARIGILMLGSKRLFIPGLFLITFGVTLHAGASGSVKAIKMSAKLTGRGPTPTDTTSSEARSETRLGQDSPT